MRLIKSKDQSSNKLNFKYIKSEFEKDGYILISKSYKNAHNHLEYICPENHKHSVTWTKWQQGKRCPYCAGNAKHTIDFVKQSFEKEGYVLLTDYYLNGKQKLNYICNKGHSNTMCWNNWQQGKRCPTCKYIAIAINQTGREVSESTRNKISEANKGRFVGPLSPTWKGGLSYEPYCSLWSDTEYKDSIKERDGYKCLNPYCYGNYKLLDIHHINYNKKDCRPDNLITICRSCNARANKDREWHESWYSTIIKRRYNYKEVKNANSN